MKPLSKFSDIHSHRKELATRGDTVVSICPDDQMADGGTYSVGIHPWDSDKPAGLSSLKKLVEMARDPRTVAIGECGFDRLRGGSIDRQRALFDFHARLAKKLGKPLIIHAVRSDDIILEAARRHRPDRGSWIIHGFRGKPQAAQAFLRAGIALSLGRRFNPAVVDVIPADMLYRESDDAEF